MKSVHNHAYDEYLAVFAVSMQKQKNSTPHLDERKA